MSDKKQTQASEVVAIAQGSEAARIPVHISYEIIRLFSEGLYQSPQKAVEELVSNSYDADASSAHVLLPRESDVEGEELAPLWVVDDGSGMDAEGFFQLWRVAESSKAAVSPESVPRPPIGQFGIGKLAAYVLAWRLTHISRRGDRILATAMNFRDLAGIHQYEASRPFDLSLRELSEEQAREALADIEDRDPAAWQLLFGKRGAKSWTVAALSDFKDLYSRLSAGRLAWVLSTGLPLHSNFKIYLDGVELVSSKANLKVIRDYSIGGDGDHVASALGLTSTTSGIVIPGIAGDISGQATIYEKRLTEGKSDQYDRSHGFFVRVRGRVINLEDELFGLDALNHSAWSRFTMEVDADGLREHLLSSREGVRESAPIEILRKYLHGVFNVCRKAYDDWYEKQLAGLDIEQLLRDAPSLFITEPLLEGVRQVVMSGEESFYVGLPPLQEGEDAAAWIAAFATAVADSPISGVDFVETGQYDRPLRYDPETRTLRMNTTHPFVDKLIAAGRDRGAATLFGSSELLLDVLMQQQGVSLGRRIDLLNDRDRVLRVLAGDPPSTAREVLRLLAVANHDETALERAVGAAFRVLGFEYERRGGNVGGTDGVLYARLGRGTETLSDYKVVYDAKQTAGPSVPADKISLSSIEDFRLAEDADYAFFAAGEYAAQLEPNGKINKMVTQAVGRPDPQPITLLRIDDLRRIVELHYRYGVTLTRIRSLFEGAHTVPEVQAWIDELESELTTSGGQVPLQRLLTGLEEAKLDEKARPNVPAVRALDQSLQAFEPERLVAALEAVQTIIGSRWLEVDRSGDVLLHSTASQISAEVERNLGDMFGIDARHVEADASTNGDTAA